MKKKPARREKWTTRTLDGRMEGTDRTKDTRTDGMKK